MTAYSAYDALFGAERDEDTPIYCGLLTGDRGFTWLGLGTDLGEDEEDKGLIEFLMSTDIDDRMGDAIHQGSWLLKWYLKNPVFLSDHKQSDVVGVARKVWRQKGEDGKTVTGLRSRVMMDESEKNPRGVLIGHQHRNGFRRAVSVGFYPHKVTSRTKLPPTHPKYTDPATVEYSWMAGLWYEDNELLEHSSVGVPANPEALQASMELWRAENKEEAVSRYLGETLDRRSRALILDALRNDQEVQTSLLTLIMGQRTLPPTRNPNPDSSQPTWLRGLVGP